METSSELQVAVNLAISAGIGALIGVERERRTQNGQPHAAGIRTFTLVAVLGFLSALLGSLVSPLFLFGMALAIGALAIVIAVLDVRRGDVGITTEVALLIAFALGVLVHSGQAIAATAIAVAVTLVLSLKIQMHSFAGRLSEDDLFAIIKFVVAAALVLPLLPSSPLDEAGILVPRQIGLTVVLVLALNFVSYFLAKFWDAQKSILATAILGGLISSTIVTWTLSGRSRDNPSRAREYALGTLLAILVMLPRVSILAFIVNSAFGAQLIYWLAALAAAGAVPIWILRTKVHKASGSNEQITLGNPFELQEGLRFGVLFVLIVYVVHHARTMLGESGLYLATALAGIADLDAITLSLAQMVPAALNAHAATGAVLLAINVNNLVKLVIALSRGTSEYRAWVSGGVAALLAAGAAIHVAL